MEPSFTETTERAPPRQIFVARRMKRPRGRHLFGPVLAAAFLLLATLVMLNRYTLHVTWKDAAIDLRPDQSGAIPR
jgi:hypothetical protein